MKKKRVLFIFGTRPEAIKLAPVIIRARKDKRFIVDVCNTGQHKGMADQVLAAFKIRQNFRLKVMKHDQTLQGLTANLINKLEKVFKKKYDAVITQGDTTTAFVGSLMAFYFKTNLCHVEAGLRTHQRYFPFPEEINRKLISAVATIHYAPTTAAKRNLREENVSSKSILVTGNTIVDAVDMMKSVIRKNKHPALKRISKSNRLVLVTLHRRESFGLKMREICRTLVKLTREFKDIEIIIPVHQNPNVKKAIFSVLSDAERVHLIKPLSYIDFLTVLQRSYLVLTDSGGVQEEAPSFKRPVLVLRDTSERMEGVDLNVAKLVGTNARSILKSAKEILSDSRKYKKMAGKKNPYGDGKASSRILNHLAKSI